MQLKITGWIRFEKFRGTHAPTHTCTTTEPLAAPLTTISAQVAPQPSSAPEQEVTVADHQAVTIGPNDVTANDDVSDTGPIERPYREEIPRAVIQGNHVTVNVFGDNDVRVNVFDGTVTVTSASD